MTSIEVIAQLEKRCTLIESTGPYLRKCYGEEKTKDKLTNLNSVQWVLIVKGNDAGGTV